MAVRVALGAGRFRLMRQVLAEALLLSAAGGLLAMVLAYFGAVALARIMTSGRFIGGPPQIKIAAVPDVHVLLFTGGIALLTGVLFGLAPAWSAFTSGPAAALREIGAAGETRLRRLFGKSLVVTQMALSVGLLSAAGLFIRNLATWIAWIWASAATTCCWSHSTRRAADIAMNDCPVRTRSYWCNWGRFRACVRQR
jgi:hypothetical protein